VGTRFSCEGNKGDRGGCKDFGEIGSRSYKKICLLSLSIPCSRALPRRGDYNVCVIVSIGFKRQDTKANRGFNVDKSTLNPLLVHHALSPNRDIVKAPNANIGHF
jgi:hypothetical protein